MKFIFKRMSTSLDNELTEIYSLYEQGIWSFKPFGTGDVLKRYHDFTWSDAWEFEFFSLRFEATISIAFSSRFRYSLHRYFSDWNSFITNFFTLLYVSTRWKFSVLLYTYVRWTKERSTCLLHCMNLSS